MGFVPVLFVCKALGFQSTGCREDCIHSCRLQYTLSFANLPEPLQPSIADRVLVPFHKTMALPLFPVGASTSAYTSRESFCLMQSSLLWSNLVFSIFTYSELLQTAGCTCCPLVFFGSTLQAVILVLWNSKLHAKIAILNKSLSKRLLFVA